MQKKQVGFSKIGFMIAIFGSSIGLGSIWRFPTIMAQSGGAAFLIPFTISIIICGIPFLMFEMNIGNKFKKVQVDLFSGFYGKKGRFFGYFYPTLAFLITSFYVIVIGWVLLQIIISFTNNLFIKNFLFANLLKTPDSVKNFNDIGLPNIFLVLSLLFIFGFAIIVSLMGLKSGLEKLNRFLIPALFVILIFLMIYCMTLDGAAIGLNKMWEPDWKSLSLTKVWTNAFSQSFFSLSIAMGTVIYFSSKTASFQDNNNSAFVMALPIVLVSIIAGMMNFSALGFLAKQSGQSIDDIVGKRLDPGLIFDAFPQIFSKISEDINWFFGHFLSILFYCSLFSAGIMTLVALIEVICGNFRVDSKLDRKTTTFLWVFGLFLMSLIFATKGGKFLINGIDIWVNNIWLFFMAICEIVFLLLTIKNKKITINDNWKRVIATSNQHSWIKIGKKYTLFLLSTIPILLVIIGFNFYDLFVNKLSNPEDWIPYFIIGTPIGFGVQILIPLIMTYKTQIFIFFSKKKSKDKF